MSGWTLRITLIGSLLLVLPALPSLAGTATGTQGDLNLQALLLLGLEENLGLRADRILTLQTAAEVEVQAAQFDAELFAAASHADSQTPVADSDHGGELHAEQTRAEVGIRKRFATGLESSVALGTGRSGNDLEILDPSYTSYLLLNLRQPLLRNFGSDTNTAELHIARLSRLQSRATFLGQARDLGLQIELACYDLAGARQTEQLRRQARELVTQLLEANRAKLAAGLIPITEVQEAETALAGSELRLALARQKREQAGHRLNGLFDAGSEFQDIASRLGEVSLLLPEITPQFSAVYPVALSKRSDFAALGFELESQGLRSAASDNQTKPNLDLQVSLGVSGLSGDEPAGSLPLPHAGDYFESYSGLAEGDGYQWSAGLVFSYPLGNREAQARAEQARLAERRTVYRRQELERQIATELRQRLTDLERLAEQYQIAEQFQSLAERTLSQEYRRLEEGLSDTFRTLVFQQQMINASIDRLNSLVDYNKSLAGYYQTLGTNLERYRIIANLDAKELYFENR